MRNFFITFSILLLFTNCSDRKKSEKLENRNIEHFVTDAKIVGDFDREKYPILQNAIILKLNGELEKSIEEFNKAENEYGKMIPIYLNRGDAFDQIGKIKEAENDYSNCLELDSTYLPALLNRGLIYTHTKRIDKAFFDFNKAIELKPNEPVSYFNRAIAYREINEIELACTDLKKAKNLGFSKKYNSEILKEMINQLNCEKITAYNNGSSPISGSLRKKIIKLTNKPILSRQTRVSYSANWR